MPRDRLRPGAAFPRRVFTVLTHMLRSHAAFCWLLAAAVAHAAPSAPVSATKPAPPLLPETFAGFHLQGARAAHAGPEAAATDLRHGAVLREDGLLEAAAATYTAPAATLLVKVYRFSDATGAYAAFTAYREAAMTPESVGVEGAAHGGRHLFWVGATLVDAELTGADAQAPADLGALAAALPQPHGPAAVTPPLRSYLPAAALVRSSIHYAIGPAGYAASGGPLPESVIDFSRDAEAATARYTLPGGAMLTLLSYPTPQIAAGRERAIQALVKSGAISGTLGAPGVVAERIGPLVAFTSGNLTEAQAHALIRSVHYEAAVTVNHPEGYISEVSKTAKLLLGIVYLTGILGVSSLLLALFLGGGRVLIRRMRGKPASSLHDEDFISLKLQ